MSAYTSKDLINLLVSLLAIIFVVLYRRTKRGPFPPGPKGLPIVGNVRDMPTEYEWVTFAEMAKKYGEIIGLNVFGKPIIVLNSAGSVTELLERRSANFSDRPVLRMAGEICGYDGSLILQQNGPNFREHRKLLSSVLSARKVELIEGIQDERSRVLIADILDTPKDFVTHAQRFITHAILRFSHGYTAEKDHDEFVQLAEQAISEFTRAMVPGAFLVDVLPILKYIPSWFPGAGFQRTGKQWRKTMERLRDYPYEVVKQRVLNGTAEPSFTSRLIELNPSPEEEFLYKWSTGGLYPAGTETVLCTLQSFFLVMLLYPEIQKKAQAELDRVVGNSRLPSFQDRKDLLYIDALIKELHRWNPAFPLGVAHASTSDDMYNGYLIPAGSTILANNWAIMKDPERYPSPLEFLPERYLSENPEGINTDPHAYAFGYGRRICPGMHFADSSLFISIAMILSVFDIRKPLGKNEEPI